MSVKLQQRTLEKLMELVNQKGGIVTADDIKALQKGEAKPLTFETHTSQSGNLCIKVTGHPYPARGAARYWQWADFVYWFKSVREDSEAYPIMKAFYDENRHHFEG